MLIERGQTACAQALELISVADQDDVIFKCMLQAELAALRTSYVLKKGRETRNL
jgi:hypothetical protein